MNLPRLRHLTLTIAIASVLPICAQTPPPAGQPAPQQQPAPSGSASPASTYALLQPPIAQLRDVLAGLRPDKWKVPSAVSQQTTANLSSIQRDLDNTLPGLITTADQAPNSVSAVLPAYRNLDALYDVVLRVPETAVLAAPAQQSSALQQATGALSDARRALGDRLQAAAAADSKSITTLQAQLKTAQAAATTAAVPAACPPPPDTTKKKPVRLKAKPATPSTTTQSTTPPATSH